MSEAASPRSPAGSPHIQIEPVPSPVAASANHAAGGQHIWRRPAALPEFSPLKNLHLKVSQLHASETNKPFTKFAPNLLSIKGAIVNPMALGDRVGFVTSKFFELINTIFTALPTETTTNNGCFITAATAVLAALNGAARLTIFAVSYVASRALGFSIAAAAFHVELGLLLAALGVAIAGAAALAGIELTLMALKLLAIVAIYVALIPLFILSLGYLNYTTAERLVSKLPSLSLIPLVMGLIGRGKPEVDPLADAQDMPQGAFAAPNLAQGAGQLNEGDLQEEAIDGKDAQVDRSGGESKRSCHPKAGQPAPSGAAGLGLSRESSAGSDAQITSDNEMD